MAVREVTIRDEVGLHARPAAQFAKTAAKFESEIVVRKGDRSADAKSLLEVLTLEANQGSVVEIEASGDDAEEALATLAGMLDPQQQ